MSHLHGWRLSDSAPVQIRATSTTRMTAGHVDAGTISGKSKPKNTKKRRTKRR